MRASGCAILVFFEPTRSLRKRFEPTRTVLTAVWLPPLGWSCGLMSTLASVVTLLR
jgi:hypothetical protein